MALARSAPTHGQAPCRLGARSAILLPMPKHPKPTAEPPTAPNRLTPQEIDELREHTRQMDEEIRSKLAARKKQAEAK